MLLTVKVNADDLWRIAKRNKFKVKKSIKKIRSIDIEKEKLFLEFFYSKSWSNKEKK